VADTLKPTDKVNYSVTSFGSLSWRYRLQLAWWMFRWRGYILCRHPITNALIGAAPLSPKAKAQLGIETRLISGGAGAGAGGGNG